MKHETADRANALYHYLLRYYADTGAMPTIREIMPALGVVSSCSAWHYLNILEQWGWIRRLPGAAHAITLTRATEAGLTPGQLAAMLEQYTELSEGGL